MSFEWFAFHGPPARALPLTLPGILIALAYAALAILLFVRDRRSLVRLTARRWAVFAVLGLLSLPLAWLARLNPVSDVPEAFPLGLASLVPPLLAALWLGPGPAISLGAVVGLAAMLVAGGRLTLPFEVALISGTSAILIDQRYTGMLARVLRQPLIAALSGALVVGWPLALVAIFGTSGVSAPSSLDRTIQVFAPALLSLLFVSLGSGVVAHIAAVLKPQWLVARSELEPPPWEQRLGQRLLLTFLPLGLLAIAALGVVVAVTSYRVATQVVVSEMGRDAARVASDVPGFLREGSVGSGEGFVIDDQGHIVLDPALPSRQGETFTLGSATPLIVPTDAGRAFRQRGSDGSRSLIYMLPVEDPPDGSVVVVVPNEVALSLAAQFALPALLLLVGIAVVAVPLWIAAMRRIGDPLGQLLSAVDAFGESEVDTPVRVSGADEIGRLGAAFERVRVHLRDRLNEQERLLRVSRSVASSLELFRAMPPILSSALEVAEASGVRIAIRSREGDGDLESYAAGEAAAIMAPLDRSLSELVEKQGTVVISQLWRASGAVDTTPLLPRIQALVALPLRSETSFHGVLWLAYDHEHNFEQPELTFLSTLAEQAAIAIANHRLFSEAEEERRKLEAVLASTADAMIVADNQGRIVLVNPAAEKYLGNRADRMQGRPAGEVIPVAPLAEHLCNLEEPVAEIELSGQRGKTLLANISTIVGHDGTITGRVAVMRDITALKELDNIKTVFLRMVSHDLRSPLTYMRGYLSMLPLAGELNERQHDATQKIAGGIDSISDLTERLLYLSRLQFGEEAQLELSLVDVETLVKQIVIEQEQNVHQREVTVRLEAEEKLPLLPADEMLYRQAIANLVNNAVKYSPDAGEVVVRVFKSEEGGASQMTVAVTDTGMGIREEDQPRLFEAFYRVPQREGEPPRPRGSGLGLALVKAIAITHGGTVGVQSTLGGGSTFHITLPIRSFDELE